MSKYIKKGWKAWEGVFPKEWSKVYDPDADRPSKLRRLSGGVDGDGRDTTLPMTINEMVRVTRADIAGDLKRAIEAGKAAVTIGLGAAADIQLLDDDLLAAEVSLELGEVLILKVLFSPRRAFSLARGHGTFGVYYGNPHDADHLFRYRQVDGLLPGVKVGLGSCPGDAVWFQLPNVRGVHFERTGAERRPKNFKVRYQAQFHAALLHWRYDEITFGSEADRIIRMADTELEGLRGAIARHPDDPSAGYRLTVENHAVAVHYCRRGSDQFQTAVPGEVVKLDGHGNRIRFGEDHHIELSAPKVVAPRFTGRYLPSEEDIVAVLGLHPDNMRDPHLVKVRYRELIRRLHPDRVGENDGHRSRFLEVQACWQVYERNFT